MTISRSLISALAASHLLSACIQPAIAGRGDLHLGGFKGMWCGYVADFSLDRQNSDGSWVFHGHVTFPGRPEYANVNDPFDVEQRTNNSLIMVRHLTDGRYQRVFTDTGGPGGQHFQGVRAEGPDCVGKHSEMDVF
jgi:hypothetical protein